MSAQSHSVVLVVPPTCFSGPVPIPVSLFLSCSVFSDTYIGTHTITSTVTNTATASIADLLLPEATGTHTCVHDVHLIRAWRYVVIHAYIC